MPFVSLSKPNLMRNLFIFYFVCLWTIQVNAQERSGHLFFEPDHSQPCVTPSQHQAIEAALQQSRNELLQKGILKPQSVASTNAVLFDWPVAANNGLNDYGVHAISNFVDHNAANPNQLQDYNCGSRTYDVSGYNHAGTDIFTWPFWWYKMDNNQVKVIAAAAGTIIYKSDNNYDRNCASNSSNWNAVYIQHSDGSVAWYGHLKSGSLTTKTVGQTVSTGEYLGIVGSSGNSTGPHLHFEVYDASNNLVDPYAGSCNNFNTSSCWNAQRPYYDSYINALRTHSAPPVFPNCPQTETPNEKNQFCQGDLVYYAAYYRDQLSGQVSDFTIIAPDNSVYMQWSNTFNVFYAASYWYWSYYLPSNAMTGTWKYKVSYLGNNFEHDFDVVGSTTITANNNGVICPGANVTLQAPTSTYGFSYQWYRNSIAISGATNQVYTTNLTGSYHCILQINGCSSTSNTLVISTGSTPNISITSSAANDSVCSSGQLTLTASGANTYAWSNGISNGVAFNPSSTATYTVTATDVNGCTATATKLITVYTCPACLADITIATSPFSQALTESQTWIQSSGTVLIPSSAQVKWDADAGNGYVELHDGFFAESGCVFIAQAFNGCGNGSPQRPSNDETKLDAQLYPNPNHGLFYVQHPTSNSLIQIFEASGRQILHYNTNHTSLTTIDLQLFAKGIYYVKLSDGTVLRCSKYE